MIIGIVGDLHLPFSHPNYQRFCIDTFEKWNVSKIHFIGDIADQHATSNWTANVNGWSAGHEFNEAVKDVQSWYKLFPAASVSIGNHDERIQRKAFAAGLPDRYLKRYRNTWQPPRWRWELQHTFDGVQYLHGTGSSGRDAAYTRARDTRQSLVMGHIHSFPGVKYHANDSSLIFGLNVGCGIDATSYAANYQRQYATRPVLGCGVVLDGHAAFFVPMDLGPKSKYRRK